MKRKMEVEIEYGYMVIDGKYYEHKKEKGRQYLVEVSKTKYQNRIKRAKEIVKKIEKSLDREKVLMEAVMTIADEDFDKLYKMLFKSKKKYKAKTREHECVDMKIGNFVLPIMENK